MSEYQYYEFQTVERALNEQEKKEISQLSSRVQLSSTRAIFTYSYSDFRGKPEQVLAKYFDAMFYIANWGTMQLMFRFPQSLLNLEQIQPYCVEDFLSISLINNYAILDIQLHDEEGFGWIEGEGYLDSLIGLRQEILEQDYRLLYIAWLKAITWLEPDEQNLEPPLPPGLKKLSPSLKSFVEIFEVDENLLKIAAPSSPKQTTISDRDLQAAIKQLSRTECEEILLQLAKGEPGLRAQLNHKLANLITISPPKSPSQRTIKELLSASDQQRKQEEIRLEKEAEAQRIKDLEALAKQEDFAWKDVDNLIKRGQSTSYDDALKLLLRLHDLAVYQNKKSTFQERINQIYQEYSRRSALLRRLKKAGFYQQ